MAKILLIEDDSHIMKMVASRLKANGYQVQTATDGREGLDKVSHRIPDLVITDLAMPKMNGHVVVRVLKLSEQYKHIPIIMLSAFVSGKMGDGVEVPADTYIPKPFQSEELLAKVEELLNKKKEESTGEEGG
jgi:DNA-binding response OmpR family regulator